MKNNSFSLGQLFTSCGVADIMAIDEVFSKFIHASLIRHESHDWGDMNQEDKHSNDLATHSGSRVFSTYKLPEELLISHSKVWIITEADRATTIVLFPDEYLALNLIIL